MIGCARINRIECDLIDATSPTDGGVFLQGAEVQFKGNAPANATYSWSLLQGIAFPSSAMTQGFTTTLLSTGNIKVKLVVTIDGQVCDATRTIQAVRPEVVEISFVGDDFDLKE